jgi:hypothetical protein
MSGKWLELLKEIAPRVKRVAVLRDPRNNERISSELHSCGRPDRELIMLPFR